MTFNFSNIFIVCSLFVAFLSACSQDNKTHENTIETVKTDSVSMRTITSAASQDSASDRQQTVTNEAKAPNDVITQNRIASTQNTPKPAIDNPKASTASASKTASATSAIAKNIPTKSTVKPIAKASTLQEKLVEMGLIDVKSVNPNIRVQLAYSGTDNFIKKDVYGELNQAYLQQEVAEKLSKAQGELEKLHPGWALIIYDAARPFSVQQQMWNIVKGTDMAHYVAPPDAKGSIHNYGCAVDLSITNEKGIPLDMGTPFDFFGTLAHTTDEEALVKAGKLTQKQLDNRLLLRKLMHNQGFTVLKREWWHFNAYSDAEVMRKYKRIP